MGSSYSATAWRKLAEGTQKVYKGAIHKFVRFSRVRAYLAPREAIQERLLQIVRDGHFESPVKSLLSALRFAEKMDLVPKYVVEGDWIFASALEKWRLARGQRSTWWAEADVFYSICRQKPS